METPSEGLLTPRHIVLLAKAISCRDMKAIAEGYLDISREEVVSLVDANRDDTEAITSRNHQEMGLQEFGSKPNQV